MNSVLLSAAITVAAMLLTLLLAFGLTHRGVIGNSTPTFGSAHPVHDSHAQSGLAVAACPVSPHSVSPRPTFPAKALIRT
jgi:hypothetical protein